MRHRRTPDGICAGLLSWSFPGRRRREGRRLGNLLSLLAGVAIFAFAPLLLMLGKGALPRVLEVVIISVAFAVGYLGLAFATFVLCSVGYGLLRPPHGADFLVVHGSRLIRGAVPPLLASRLDRARALYAASAARGRAPADIASGGQVADEPRPEAVGWPTTSSTMACRATRSCWKTAPPPRAKTSGTAGKS